MSYVLVQKILVNHKVLIGIWLHCVICLPEYIPLKYFTYFVVSELDINLYKKSRDYFVI